METYYLKVYRIIKYTLGTITNDGQNIYFLLLKVYIPIREMKRGYLSSLRSIPFGKQLITMVKAPF